MAEERQEEKPATPEESEAGGEPELLAGKYKNREELAKAYGELESKLGVSGTDLRRYQALKAQVEGFGLGFNDDGTIRYAEAQPDAGDGWAPGALDEDDIDAKVARMEKVLAEMGQTLDTATRTIAAGSKQQLLSKVPDASKAKAEKIYDEMLGRVPAKQRLDKGTQDAVRRVVMGQLMEEGAFDVPASPDDPTPSGKTINLGKMVAETSRPSGGGGAQKRTRLTGAAKEAHDGLSAAMKDMGVDMTEAEAAEGIEDVRRRRRSIE